MHAELSQIRFPKKEKKRFAVYRAITAPVAITIPSLASVLTFLTYMSYTADLTAETAFPVVAMFTTIRGPF